MAARVGLTGGIGSGKSTVAKLFKKHNITIIDSDAVAREITAPGSPGLDQIRAHFGESVITPDNQLDRKALGTIVFANPSEKQWLEQLLHPMIKLTSDQRAENCPDTFCIMEIPLLIETGRFKDMDQIVVVHCPAHIRVERLKDSRDMSEDVIKNVMANQVSDKHRLTIADYIIDNAGDLQALPAQVELVLNRLNQYFSDETPSQQ